MENVLRVTLGMVDIDTHAHVVWCCIKRRELPDEELISIGVVGE